MAFSIFDLYSQYPQQQVRLHGPYEFSKLPRRKSNSSTSSDSFVCPETIRDDPEEKEDPGKLPPPLLKFKQFMRRSSNGTLINVVRRKEFAPANVSTLTCSNVPGKEPVKQRHNLEKQKIKWPVSHSYMENRRYWDSVNTMLGVKRNRIQKVRPPYRKSKTMEVVRNLRRTSSSLSIVLPKPTNAKPKLYRSETKYALSPKDPVRDLRRRAGMRRIDRAPMSLEEWKFEIRERAVALVYGHSIRHKF